MVVVGLIAWREYVRARVWAAYLISRFFSSLDRLELHMRNSPGELFVPQAPPEEHPTTDPGPSYLDSFHDEVLAKLESDRRETRGADQSLVCTHWYEQDEREADAETERLRVIHKKLVRR